MKDLEELLRINSTQEVRDTAARALQFYRETLERIARMKMYPDDVINRTTLLAAIEIARASTTLEAKLERPYDPDGNVFAPFD